MSFEQAHGSQGYLILKGFSPTVLLDQAPNIQSFGGQSSEPLQGVVQQLLDQGYHQQEQYKSNIQLTHPRQLSYSCQYNETPYNFLTRLAHAQGEHFFMTEKFFILAKFPQMKNRFDCSMGVM
ncbi:contractile injection system protein, VgrG/Pvc8 family [Myroides sp. mNGS23_01]|nr:contractile injection system protein, VgrG/Pvc8 family [Myroides sp. mNGS23_01]WHT39157.1 contractile injection system protein, VgrG/Pvc8 family [Myroides sp. mNGS23_01]